MRSRTIILKCNEVKYNTTDIQNIILHAQVKINYTIKYMQFLLIDNKNDHRLVSD